MTERIQPHKPDLVNDALKILNVNHLRVTRQINGQSHELEYTAPDIGLYKHIYLWDTCFHAIGLSALDEESRDRAQRELETLLVFQRDDGFIPIVSFPTGKETLSQVAFYHYFKDGSYGTKLTQPPVLPVAIEEVYNKTKDREFLKRILPKAAKFVDYLNSARDPNGQHLATTIHPYETGIDSTPSINEQMGFKKDKPKVIPTMFKFQQLLRKHAKMKWNEEELVKSGSFRMQSVFFNSLKAQAERSLGNLYAEIGDEENSEIYLQLYEQTVQALVQKCWDPETEFFYDLDANGNQVKVKTIGAFSTLNLDIGKERADTLVHKHLKSPNEFWADYPVPSVAMDEPSFRPDGGFVIWIGETWINTNYEIIKGMISKHYYNEAYLLGLSTLQMIEKSGFREHYRPDSAKGGGAKNFGWSAALTIKIVQFVETLEGQLHPEEKQTLLI